MTDLSPPPFSTRHIGPSPSEQQRMLEAVGFESVADLVAVAVPEAIRSKDRLKLPAAASEADLFELVDELAHQLLAAHGVAPGTRLTRIAALTTDSLDALRGEGYEVLGISPDKPEKLGKFRERDALTITLLSDPDKAVLEAYGAFGEKTMYGKTVQGVIRSTFVVDEEGKVEVAQYNVKATGHVAKLRRDLGLAS